MRGRTPDGGAVVFVTRVVVVPYGAVVVVDDRLPATVVGAAAEVVVVAASAWASLLEPRTAWDASSPVPQAARRRTRAQTGATARRRRISCVR
jgi:hypothetical protein